MFILNLHKHPVDLRITFSYKTYTKNKIFIHGSKYEIYVNIRWLA